jgi:arylsulfatase A-like enzyme
LRAFFFAIFACNNFNLILSTVQPLLIVNYPFFIFHYPLSIFNFSLPSRKKPAFLMSLNPFLFLGLMLLSLSACSTEQSVKESDPPNIIYILADDLGYNELGSYGQQLIETPYLDELAKNGMRFTQHYSGSPVCAPSRCVLMTGQHTGHSFVRGNDEWRDRGEVWSFAAMQEDPNLEGQRPLPDSIITIAELLKTKGYATACVGKWGLGAPYTEGAPNEQGFDLFFGYNCQRQAHTYYPVHLWKNDQRVFLDNQLVPPHSSPLADGADSLSEDSYADYNQKDYAATLMQDEVLQFIDVQGDNPFFLYYSTPIPHVALQAPKHWVDYYRKKFGPEEPYTGRSYFPCRYPRATYAAMISYLDEQVGEIIAKLKEKNIYENTLVIFTSDNGTTFLNQVDIEFFKSVEPFKPGLHRVKGSLKEGGIRVPMIASWPGKIAANSKSDHLSAFWDVLPTLCEIAGVALPDQPLDGISFAPTLLGKTGQKVHEQLYWEYPERGGSQAIRKGNWKAFRKDLQKGKLETELYNLENDIQELNNVAAENPKIVQELEQAMKASRFSSHLPRWQLKALDEK